MAIGSVSGRTEYGRGDTMKTNITIEPESEEERVFMEQIAAARNEALDEGVSQREVARIFLVFAEPLLGEFERESGSLGGSDEKPLCPSCGVVVSDFDVPGIGEDVVVDPCGCRMPFDELPQQVKEM